MEIIVFMTGLMLCMTLSIAITMYTVLKINKYRIVMIAVLLPTLMTVTGALYNNVMQEYFIGKRVTYEQLCTEISVITLYFK